MQFEEFIGFLKHIVELAEIVEGMQNKAVPALAEGVIPMEEGIVNQYEGLARSDDRDTLLRLCGEKGISVPPRTKTPTLARMLTEHDLKARGAIPTVDPVVPSLPEPDPFGDGPTQVVTVEMVRAALTKVHTEKGLAAVMDILKKSGGGVEKIKEIPVAMYQAVYEACK